MDCESVQEGAAALAPESSTEAGAPSDFGGGVDHHVLHFESVGNNFGSALASYLQTRPDFEVVAITPYYYHDGSDIPFGYWVIVKRR